MPVFFLLKRGAKGGKLLIVPRRIGIGNLRFKRGDVGLRFLYHGLKLGKTLLALRLLGALLFRAVVSRRPFGFAGGRRLTGLLQLALFFSSR